MKIEECKERLNNVGVWIGSADNKISIGLGIFSITGLFVGFIFSENFNNLMHLKATNFNSFISVLVIFSLSLLLFAFALCFYVYGIFPRFNSAKDFKERDGKRSKESYTNFWFYKHIASFSSSDEFLKECKTKFGEIDTECMQILEEVYANSKICLKKMICFRVGIVLSLLSVLASLVCVLNLIIACVIK